MDNTLFGIPLLYWGILCIGIGVVYLYLWPRPHPRRRTPRSRWRNLVLRYGHALVWFLLAAGCLAGGAGADTLGMLLALAALPIYLIFLGTMLNDRQFELREVAVPGTTAKPTDQ